MSLWTTQCLKNCRRKILSSRNKGPIFGTLVLIGLLVYIFPFIIGKAPSYYITLKFADDTVYKLAVREKSSAGYNATVVLLHSDWYDSSKWESLRTLDILSSIGCRALAIDLPGYGYSMGQAPKEYFDKAVVLDHALVKLNASEAVLVAPSMSGSYALPLLVRGSLKLKGFVAIAPYSVEIFSKLEYSSVKIPTLIIYGVHDTTYGAPSALHLRGIPDSSIHVMLSAGHACYVDKPDEFHNYLLSFLQNLQNNILLKT